MSNGKRRVRRLASTALIGAVSMTLLAAAPASAARDIVDTCPTTTPEDKFTDTGAEGSALESATDCAVAYGLVSGQTATTLNPTGVVSRNQMATFIMQTLDKVTGFSRPANAPNAFTDDDTLPTGNHKNINDGAQLDVFNGKTGDVNNDGKTPDFDPSGDVTRGQMATFIVNAIRAAGVTLPTNPANAFSDDNGSTHEANINLLAALDIADGLVGDPNGDGQSSDFGPNNDISRGQMVLFLVRNLDLLVEAGKIPKLGAGTGIITAVNAAGDSYTFTANGASTTVVYDNNADTFFVDGISASLAAFEAALTVGDEIQFTDDPNTAAADADVHRLTNVSAASRRTGTVGAVNVTANTFSILDPVTGTPIGGPHTYSGDVLQVGGTAVGETAFDGAINEGDTVAGTVDAGGTETWNLTNETTTGSVSAVALGAAGDGAGTVRIGNLGDDHKDDADDTYTFGDEGGLAVETFTIGGASATPVAFEAALTVGDTLAYSRTGNTETFALTNVAPSEQSGTATDVFAPGAGGTDGGSFTMVSGANDIPVTYVAAASFLVGGTLVTEAEFEAAYNSGDQITHTPNNPDTAANEQRLALTNANLTGRPTDIVIASDRYDVVNAQGNVLEEDLVYTAATDDRYYRGATEITLADFEILLGKIAADATPDDTIEVVRTALAVEHRLTTDETVA